MDAVVSGQAGVAFLLLDDGRFASIDASEPEVVIPRGLGDYRVLFGDAGDLQFLEDVDHAKVIERLRISQDEADGLHLSLILLDAEISGEVRREAAMDLEKLFDLRYGHVRSHVEHVLFTRPLPSSADVSGALVLMESVFSPEVRRSFQVLRDCQKVISRAFLEWERIVNQAFEDPEAAREFTNEMFRQGMLQYLVKQFSWHTRNDNATRAPDGVRIRGVPGDIRRKAESVFRGVAARFLLYQRCTSRPEHSRVLTEWLEIVREACERSWEEAREEEAALKRLKAEVKPGGWSARA